VFLRNELLKRPEAHGGLRFVFKAPSQPASHCTCLTRMLSLLSAPRKLLRYSHLQEIFEAMVRTVAARLILAEADVASVAIAYTKLIMFFDNRV
jgi:hypothetical protein